jgi:molybdate transport system substrate-binding protein
MMGKDLSKQNALHVFSSGAVAPPVKKCAKEFRAKFGTEFRFRIGKGEVLIEEIAKSKKGDVLTCGAEFLLDVAQNRGLILGGTRKSLGSRKSVILVQIGNPKKIRAISDLTKKGAKIGVSVGGCLLGVWDDIASKAGLTEQIRKNITDTAEGCGELIALVNMKKVDAVLGWDAFKKLAMETMEIVELPKNLQVYRSTGVAVIKFTKKKELAEKFIDFLVSDKGKEIYEEYGWHHIVQNSVL